MSEFRDHNDLDDINSLVEHGDGTNDIDAELGRLYDDEIDDQEILEIKRPGTPPKLPVRLSKATVEKVVEFLAKDMVDELQGDLRFQDMVSRLAAEHATFKWLGNVNANLQESDDELEDLQAEIHTMVGTMLSQRIFALAATEMYFPQGGRD